MISPTAFRSRSPSIGASSATGARSLRHARRAHAFRYLNPPTSWIKAELESRELLSFCVKRLKGLNKVKLVDASFVWTEPHSRRLKVKLTIQKEVLRRHSRAQSSLQLTLVSPGLHADYPPAGVYRRVCGASAAVHSVCTSGDGARLERTRAASSEGRDTPLTQPLCVSPHASPRSTTSALSTCSSS